MRTGFAGKDRDMKNAEEMLKTELERAKKGLSPKDAKRWLWGYSDGLEYALKLLEEEKDARDGSH